MREERRTFLISQFMPTATAGTCVRPASRAVWGAAPPDPPRQKKHHWARQTRCVWITKMAIAVSLYNCGLLFLRSHTFQQEKNYVFLLDDSEAKIYVLHASVRVNVRGKRRAPNTAIALKLAKSLKFETKIKLNYFN